MFRTTFITFVLAAGLSVGLDAQRQGGNQGGERRQGEARQGGNRQGTSRQGGNQGRRQGEARQGGNRQGGNQQGGRRGANRQGGQRARFGGQRGGQQGRGRGGAARDETAVYATREALAKALRWREVGPANFSGRIVDIAVHPEDSTVWYIASASGGLFKTENRGLSFRPVFEKEGTTSIGAIAVDPSNGSTIWVGTGEANNQRSSYWGDGIYKSSDGGKTWKNMGLKDSHHIGRIAVDPKNSKRVFVAALGALYSPNEMRGLYRTTDGGETWHRVLKISPDVGVVDVRIDPHDSNIVLAASYERRRRAWNFSESGPGSGIWRSSDGGSTFARVEGGLPKGKVGRIGIAFAPSKKGVVYATVENGNPAPVRRRTEGRDAEPEAQPKPKTEYVGGPNVVHEPAGSQSQDQGNSRGTRRGGAQGEGRGVRGNQGRGNQARGNQARGRGQQGRGAQRRGRGQRRARNVGGEIYRSEDSGKTWTKTNRTPVGGRPGYYYGQIYVDPSNDQRVWVCSVPLYYSDNGGKSFKSAARGVHVDHHALWIDPDNGEHWVLGNDGGLCETFDNGRNWTHFENLPIAQFYAVGVDLAEPYRIYGGTQDNGSWGMPSRGPVSGGMRLEDVFKISGGDGFYVCVDREDPNTVYAESQFGGISRIDLKTMRARSIRPRPQRGEGRYRFNWMSPILISPHNHTTIYFGGNKLFKSLNRGDKWTTISDDLTTQDKKKIAGNVPHCTITTIAESPLKQGVLWVGTDDGKLWISPDDGGTWRNLNDALPKEVEGLWVSRVEASHKEAGRAYVSFTGYREDRFAPYVYVTEDFGLTFKAIHGDLPEMGPVNVVRESPRNPDVLFVGTEFGCFVSWTRGGLWKPVGENMPRVAVHDIVVHPRETDIVAATHGRGMWVCDVGSLEGWTDEASGELATLLSPRRVMRFGRGKDGGYTRQSRQWRAPAAPRGVSFAVLLPGGSDKAVLRVKDAKGTELRAFELPNDAGMHVVRWNLSTRGGSGRGGIGGFMQRTARRFRGGRGRALGKGTYRVELEADGEILVQPLVIVR